MVNLTKGTLEYHKVLDRLLHGPADYEEAEMVERLTMEDSSVREALRNAGVPDNAQVACEPWVYGTIDNIIAMTST